MFHCRRETGNILPSNMDNMIVFGWLLLLLLWRRLVLSFFFRTRRRRYYIERGASQTVSNTGSACRRRQHYINLATEFARISLELCTRLAHNHKSTKSSLFFVVVIQSICMYVYQSYAMDQWPSDSLPYLLNSTNIWRHRYNTLRHLSSDRRRERINSNAGGSPFDTKDWFNFITD